MQDMQRCSKFGPIILHLISNSRTWHAAKCCWARVIFKGSSPEGSRQGRAALAQRSGSERRSAGKWTINVNVPEFPEGEEWGYRHEEIMNLSHEPESRNMGICHYKEYWGQIIVAPFRWDLSVFLSSFPFFLVWTESGAAQCMECRGEESSRRKWSKRQCPTPMWLPSRSELRSSSSKLDKRLEFWFRWHLTFPITRRWNSSTAPNYSEMSGIYGMK